MADYKSKTIMTGEQLDAALLAALDCESNKDLALGAAANAKNYAASAESAKTAAQQAASEASASAQQAAESAAALSDTIADVSDLKAGLAKNTAADAATKRSLDALWKLNQGISYQFETDDTEAYSKTVPTGAKCADVQMIGGKTVAWNQKLPIFSRTTKGIEISRVNDGTVTVTGTVLDVGELATFSVYECVNGHTYFTCSDNTNIGIQFYPYNGTYYGKYIHAIKSDCRAFVQYKNPGVDTVINDAGHLYLFDLTQLFGTGNEPTTTDDPRIAWIEQYAAAHPEYNAGELVSADMESVKYNDSVVCEIPESVRAILGYGWSAGDVYNSIERTDKGWQYVQRVGSIDIGTLTYSYDATNKNFYSTDLSHLIKQNTNDQIANVICAMYTAISSNSFVAGPLTDDKLTFVNATKTVCFRNLAYEDAAAFKAAMSGVMLYYELAEPIITDITDIMTLDFDAIPVEAGGTVTFENSALLAVPNSLEYAVSLAEVNG